MSASTPEQPPTGEGMDARARDGGAPTGDQLRVAFDNASEFTVGIEEELTLLDPETLEPAPRAPEVMSWLDGDPRFKVELPASQIEIATEPFATTHDAATALMAARRDLARVLDGRLRPIGAGVSPLGSGRGELVDLSRYERTVRDYEPVIHLQLVCALQVHVAVPGADRALSVYNHVRSYLPWLAALAANGVFYEGRDTGLASVRPKLSDLLPRQGMAPALESWQEFAAALSWGNPGGSASEPGAWWWELRPHPGFATLEFRVPDSQATVAEVAALAAVIHALVVWLARRYDAGEQLPVAPSWRLEENRWSACRHGVEADMLDTESGERTSIRQCLERLFERLAEVATELGCSAGLQYASRMVYFNGAIGQRRAAQSGGAQAVASRLSERFLEPWVG